MGYGPKVVPISHSVRDALTAMPGRGIDRYVFSYKGKPIARDIRTGTNAAYEAAGIAKGAKLPYGLCSMTCALLCDQRPSRWRFEEGGYGHYGPFNG